MAQFVFHLQNIVDSFGALAFSLGSLLEQKRAPQCLSALAQMGKTVIIFSNTHMRRIQTIQFLTHRGFPPAFYQHVITAGEEVWRHLKERHDPFHASLGNRCYFIGSQEAMGILEDLPITRVSNIEQADFILCMDLSEWDEDIHAFKRILSQAAQANIPMICASPDRVQVVGGKVVELAGSIGSYYERLGGVVYFHGKPHQEFYLQLKRKISPMTFGDLLVIGSSPGIDAKGASLFKIHSLLVGTPRFCYEITGRIEKPFAKDQILSKLESMHLTPTYLMEELIW